MPDAFTDLTWRSGDTIEQTFTGLVLDAGWDRMHLLVKRSPSDFDNLAVLWVRVSNPAAPATDGLVLIESMTPETAQVQASDAALVVDAAAGTITLTVAADVSAWLDDRRWIAVRILQESGDERRVVYANDALTIQPR